MKTDIIQRTREHFANSAEACIQEVLSGQVKVNDMDRYIKWRKEQKQEALEGKYDHTLHFKQVAHYLETGETLAILP